MVNASKAFSEGEFEKAGEFLWGAIADALKAHAAAINSRKLNDHKQIIDYAIELSEKQKDHKIRQEFFKVKNLHGNFYEAGMDPREVEDIMISARPVVGKILTLAGFPPSI